jgi:hypothetical protein
MSVLTTVMYGQFTGDYHRIGLFGGSNSQRAYISSTWKCGMTSDPTNCETLTSTYIPRASASSSTSQASLTYSSFTPITATYKLSYDLMFSNLRSDTWSFVSPNQFPTPSSVTSASIPDQTFYQCQATTMTIAVGGN